MTASGQVEAAETAIIHGEDNAMTPTEIGEGHGSAETLRAQLAHNALEAVEAVVALEAAFTILHAMVIVEDIGAQPTTNVIPPRLAAVAAEVALLLYAVPVDMVILLVAI
jgi:hypothetical protein